MSPQVASNLNYDFKTDIWSLGITCVELVEGEPPFSNLDPNKVMEKISKRPPKVDEIINLNEHTYEFKSFIEHCLELDPNKRYTAQQLLKHEFITKFTKGRRYMINLIKKHVADVEKYRIDSEKEYQKILKINEINKKNMKKEELFPEEDCDEDIYFKKVNYNGTAGEFLNLNFDSLENKIDKFIKKNREEHKENGGVKSNDLNHMEKKEEKEESDEFIEIEITKKDCLNSPEKENIIYIDKNNIKMESNNKNNNSSNSKIIKDNDSNKSLNGNECLPMSDLLANAPTDDNSKRTNSNEDSNKSNVASAIKEKKDNIQSSKDIFKIFENNNVNDNDNNIEDDDKKSNIVRTPSMFQNNPNDISYINSKENDENIDDSDDEEITNKSNCHNNYFKSLETYLNKEKNIYCENNINKYGNNNKIKNSF
jgi:serine/threonine protein kinase